LLDKNPYNICWYQLAKIPSAIQLLENNPDKIDWNGLSYNPRIFTYDYKKMKQNCLLFKEDLIKNRFHPCNISKFKDWGVNGFESN